MRVPVCPENRVVGKPASPDFTTSPLLGRPPTPATIDRAGHPLSHVPALPLFRIRSMTDNDE